MRRNIGISGLQREAKRTEEFQKAGQLIAAQQLQQATESFENFKSNLQQFAKKHAQEIQQNPLFRNQFHRMCLSIGVDPLSSNKGIWAEMLGVGDFYFELGIQIVQVCIETRAETGGIISFDGLQTQVQRIRGNSVTKPISKDDLESAIKSLQILGHGYQIIFLKDQKYLQSVPREFSQDTTNALRFAQDHKGIFTQEDLISEFNWDCDRAEMIINNLILEGLCWVDEQNMPSLYFISSLFLNKD